MPSLNVSALTTHLSPSENYHPRASISDDNAALCFNVMPDETFTFTKIKLLSIFSFRSHIATRIFLYTAAPFEVHCRTRGDIIIHNHRVPHPRKLYLLKCSFMASANIVETRVAHYLALSEPKKNPIYKRAIQFNDYIEEQIRDYGG